jgi:hypothetical protein
MPDSQAFEKIMTVKRYYILHTVHVQTAGGRKGYALARPYMAAAGVILGIDVEKS